MNRDLTVGNEKKVLFFYTLPLLFSMVFQQLYNIADSFVAGRFIGPDALAAVGNSYELTLIYIAFANGLNIGVGVIVSQYFGAKDIKKVKSAINTSYVFLVSLVFVLTILGLITSRPILKLIKTPDAIFNDSELYIKIYVLGLIFLFLYNSTTGIFTALGDSKTPFFFLAFSSLFNIIMDIVFVKYFSMGVKGVAYATFLCQGLSAFLSLGALLIRVRKWKNLEKGDFFSFSILKQILFVAIPSTLQQGFVSIGNIVIQSVINSFGALVMASYAASIKLNNLVITSFHQIGNAVSSFSAQNLGADKKERVVKGRKEALLLSSIFALFLTIMYFFFSPTLMRLFVGKNNESVVKGGVEFLRLISPFYIVILIKIVTDAVLRGSGDMKPFMYSTFVDLVLRVAFSIVFSSILGPFGIWLGWPLGWSLGTFISVYFYKKGSWKEKVIISR